MGDQPVGQPVGEVDLADQRVREQGVEDPVAPAVEGGVERELLVGRHVAISPAYSGSSGATGTGSAPCRADPGRHLDDVVVVEERQRAVVATLTTCTVDSPSSGRRARAATRTSATAASE